MEYWNNGMLGRTNLERCGNQDRNNGMTEYWNNKGWNNGILERWNIGETPGKKEKSESK
jgi:hypothetical protein